VSAGLGRSVYYLMARTLRAAPSGCGFHPPAVRRFAPAIQRMQRTDSAASKLALRPPLIRSPLGGQK